MVNGMKRLFFLIVGLVLVGWLLPLPASAGMPPKKTLPAQPGLTVIWGDQVAALLGASPDKMRLLAVDEDGQSRLIPFQIDERDDAGLYVLANASNKLRMKVHDRDLDDGKLDENDEIVFRTDDSGGKALEDERFFGAVRVLEIELTDGGKKAWVYLALYEEKVPTASDERAISYQRSAGLVKTALYEVGYASKSRELMPVSLRLTGGDGLGVLDRAKFRLHWPPPDGEALCIAESHFRNLPGGDKLGPLRLIRRSEHLIVVPGLAEFPLEIDTLFTPTTISLQGFLTVPPNVADAKEVTLTIGLDMTSAASPMTLVLPQDRWTVDGRRQPEEPVQALASPPWLAYVGHGMTFFFFADATTGERVKKQLLYTDDVRAEAGPDGEPGAFGQALMQFDLKAVDETIIALNAHLVFFPGDFAKAQPEQARRAVYGTPQLSVTEVFGPLPEWPEESLEP